MKRSLPFVFEALHLLTLALWLGGSGLLLLVALPTTAPGSDAARFGMVLMLQGWSRVVEVCGLIAIGIQFLQRRRYQRDRPRYIADGVRQLLTFGAFFLAEYARYQVLPLLVGSASAVPTNRFIELQHIYSLLAGAQFALLIVILGVTSWLPLESSTRAASPRPLPQPPEQQASHAVPVKKASSARAKRR
jgi:hypothetical protein